MRKPKGLIIYDGPSMYNGEPIVGILTGLKRPSRNVKTGEAIQTYILVKDEKPVKAQLTFKDEAVCGNCPLRPYLDKSDKPHLGACYVDTSKGPTAIFKSFLAGGYEPLDKRKHRPLLEGQFLRHGSYGDPALMPLSVVRWLSEACGSWTGYTHMWRSRPRGFARYLMASCETEQDVVEAQRRGYRTFRTRKPDTPLLSREGQCPASAEAGMLKTCSECRACDGRRGEGDGRASISIVAHGLQWKRKRFLELTGV